MIHEIMQALHNRSLRVMPRNRPITATIISVLKFWIVLYIPIIAVGWGSVFKMLTRCEGVKSLPLKGITGVEWFYTCTNSEAVGNIHGHVDHGLQSSRDINRKYGNIFKNIKNV